MKKIGKPHIFWDINCWFLENYENGWSYRPYWQVKLSARTIPELSRKINDPLSFPIKRALTP